MFRLKFEAVDVNIIKSWFLCQQIFDWLNAWFYFSSLFPGRVEGDCAAVARSSSQGIIMPLG